MSQGEADTDGCLPDTRWMVPLVAEAYVALLKARELKQLKVEAENRQKEARDSLIPSPHTPIATPTVPPQLVPCLARPSMARPSTMVFPSMPRPSGSTYARSHDPARLRPPWPHALVLP